MGKRNVWTAQRNLENFELDTKRMEELFSNSEQHGVVRKGGTVRKSVWGLSQTITETDDVSAVNRCFSIVTLSLFILTLTSFKNCLSSPEHKRCLFVFLGGVFWYPNNIDFYYFF